MKEDWGTGLAEGIQQFVQTHQMYKQLWMQKAQIDMAREQLKLQKDAQKMEQDKLAFDMGQKVATIMDQPVALSDVGKLLGIDLSQTTMPVQQEKQPTSGQGVVPEQPISSTQQRGMETVQKPLMFKPQKEIPETGGVQPIDIMGASIMQSRYTNLTPEFIMYTSLQFNADKKSTMKDYTEMLEKADKLNSDKAQQLGVPIIDWPTAKSLQETTYPNLDPWFIMYESSYFNQSGEQDPKKLADVLAERDKENRIAKEDKATKTFDPVKYATDRVGQNTNSAQGQAGLTGLIGEITGDQLKVFDNFYAELNNQTMDGIKASSVYTNAEKDVMLKILSSSSGKTYYSGFRTAAKSVRQKVEARKPKNDEERAKMVLEEMAKDGFKVSDITTFNSILKFADQYLKR
jgi:hypothetical protein